LFLGLPIIRILNCGLSHILEFEFFRNSCNYLCARSPECNSENWSGWQTAYVCLVYFIVTYVMIAIGCSFIENGVYAYAAYDLSVDFRRYIKECEESLKYHLNAVEAYQQSRKIVKKINEINSTVMVVHILFGIISFSYYFRILLKSDTSFESVFTISIGCIPFVLAMILSAEANANVCGIN